MTPDVVRRAAASLVRDDLAGPELTVVWHAGEPLAAPPTFYEDAIGLIADELGAGCEVTHSIQTNATLIDDRWCELFRRHRVRIGVSIDGPEDLHDRHRRTRQGKGTHAAVMRGIAALRAAGVPFHAICVLTAASLDRADDLADFFIGHGILDVGLNFDELEGRHAASSLSGHEAAHAKLLGRMLERCMAADPPLRVRELVHACDVITHEAPAYTFEHATYADNAQVIPFALISVAADGTFSTFSPELLGQPDRRHADFALGNVAEGSYLDCTTREPFLSLFRAVRKGVEGCRDACEYFPMCGGGSPVNKLAEAGSFAATETTYCRLMHRHPIDVVLDRLEREIAHAPGRRAVRHPESASARRVVQ